MMEGKFRTAKLCLNCNTTNSLGEVRCNNCEHLFVKELNLEEFKAYLLEMSARKDNWQLKGDEL